MLDRDYWSSSDKILIYVDNERKDALNPSSCFQSGSYTAEKLCGDWVSLDCSDDYSFYMEHTNSIL